MATKEQLVNAGVWSAQANAMDLGRIFYVDVACTATELDASTRTGKVNVYTPTISTEQYKVRDIVLVGGGTSFGAGGNCLLELKDGTTVYTTVANADLESAPTASLRWGDTKVPFLTSKSATATAAGAQIYFQYQTAGTAHTTGSITFTVGLERVV